MGSCLGKRSDMRAGMVLCVFWGIGPLVWCCWVILVVFGGLGLGLGLSAHQLCTTISSGYE